MQQTIIILIILVLLFTFRRPVIPWLLGIRKNVSFEDMDAFLVVGDSVKITPRPDCGPSLASTSTQITSRGHSIIYTVTTRKDKKIVETIDICVSGQVGIYVTFADNEVAEIMRPGGPPHRPELDAMDYNSAFGLLQRVRMKLQK